MCVHTSLPEPPSTSPTSPLSVITQHQAELLVLFNSFPLAICFAHGGVYIHTHTHTHTHTHKYMSMLLSQFILPLLPLLCTQGLSLCRRLYYILNYFSYLVLVFFFFTLHLMLLFLILPISMF